MSRLNISLALEEMLINSLNLINVMQKRGQVTMFVILGILIVVVIAIALSFRYRVFEGISQFELVKSEKAKQMENDLRSHAESCLEKVTIEGLQEVLISGGYYKNAPKSVSYSMHSVPYYLYLDKETIPGLGEIEANLASYIEGNINPCMLSYSSGLVVGTPKADVSLGKAVRVSLKDNLVLTSGDAEVRLKRFDVEVDADVEHAYDSCMLFYNEVKNISVTSLDRQGQLASASEFSFYNPDMGSNDTFVYILNFNSSIEGFKGLEYAFAIKYPEPSGTFQGYSSEVIAVDDLELDDGESAEINPQLKEIMDEETLNEIHGYSNGSGPVE